MQILKTLPFNVAVDAQVLPHLSQLICFKIQFALSKLEFIASYCQCDFSVMYTASGRCEFAVLGGQMQERNAHDSFPWLRGLVDIVYS